MRSDFVAEDCMTATYLAESSDSSDPGSILYEIYNGMNKAEDESLCGPVDDNVDSHIVGVNGDFLGIYPKVEVTLSTQLVAATGEAGKAHTEVCVTVDQLLRSHE
jgi:hypothetical protein